MAYRAATADIIWALAVQGGGIDTETHQAIFDEAAKLAEGSIAPLNTVGDKAGTPMVNGTPKMPAGFKAAYDAFCAGGWNGAAIAPEHGGQGLPWAVVFGLNECWQGANLAFGLCPLLTQGAAETITAHGTAEQIATYVPKLASGTWTGTMNLTEPDAGSDLGAVKAMATPQADGTYRVKGQKIFITYGNHDLAENIIHLVLARTPDAPAGSRGLSLFIVPKMLADDAPNDVQSVAVEHKMGIHASPTCTMVFGDNQGAVGYLLGTLHSGLKHMFTMMNNARLSVGIQGVGLAARAESMAYDFARERVQGTDIAVKSDAIVPIIRHADVRRMLLTLSALTDAARHLAIRAGKALDDGDMTLVEILTPLVKAFATDVAVRAASEGVQVYGGMGFVEDGGMAQCHRDARILPIYEGTNGIQAMDFVFRKLGRDNGASFLAYMHGVRDMVEGAPYRGDDLAEARQTVLDGFTVVERCVASVAALAPDAKGAIAKPMLDLTATALGAAYMYLSATMAQTAMTEGGSAILTPEQLDRKIVLAGFYAGHILTPALGLERVVTKGARCVAVLH